MLAELRGGRTVIARLRADGLLRASRPFAEGLDARLMFGHLGPGYVRGDTFATDGHVASGATLYVTGQQSARVLSGPDAVTAQATWVLEDGATLTVIGEPTLIAGGAGYIARTTYTVGRGASVCALDVTRRDPGGRLDIRTTVFAASGAPMLIDAMRIDADNDDVLAVGTLLFAGRRPPTIELDAAASASASDSVRLGVGTFSDGAVVRALGASVRDVRAALETVLAVTAAKSTADDRIDLARSAAPA